MKLNVQLLKQVAVLYCLTLLLVGCASERYRSSGPIHDPYAVKPDPVRTKKYVDRAAIPEQQVIDQSAYIPQRPEPIPQQASSPAVVALLGNAESSSKAGNLNAAAATIERALRIEPRNATLVYKLAEVRMQQHKPRLAEDLAKKANILASGDTGLKKQIWTLIANSRSLQGNTQGAAEAKAKASSY